ncbi:hypothetical protein PIROE2DRAFT_5237 [Piromyces sp. E2]|nr:hypothetical protein PIROE2DRAFT_5237 [Piromyces sp. E2]|eukprot:OUM67374.1 hypothetical protein PIROE2DRAFT_5237 [Piromyces sp. E2]
MKLCNIFKGIGILLLISSVYAYDEEEVEAYVGDCKEIVDYLKEKEIEVNINDCQTNEEGRVTKLDTYTYCITEEIANKLISYKTLTSLYVESRNSPVSKLYYCDMLNTFPSAIAELPNLETLNIIGFKDFKKNDLLTVPKTVKSL